MKIVEFNRGLNHNESSGNTLESIEIDCQLGLGVGLRNTHFDHILTEQPHVDWFEAISENFMDSGGRPRAVLREIAQQYPIVLHGVSMSIGSTDPLDKAYLSRLRKLADEIDAKWVSDHLCWTGILGINSHDLLPLPLNESVLEHIIERVIQAQDILERPLVLENPSTYVGFRDTTMNEPDFFRALSDATGCRLLLDVNNVFVSCFNAGTDPKHYLDAFPFDKVIQLHLAGHQHCGTHIVDTHDQPVCNEVWELFHIAWQQTNGVATLLEWDGDVPDFDRVHQEVLRARRYMSEIPATNITTTPMDLSINHNALSTPLDFMIPEVMSTNRMRE